MWLCEMWNLIDWARLGNLMWNVKFIYVNFCEMWAYKLCEMWTVEISLIEPSASFVCVEPDWEI